MDWEWLILEADIPAVHQFESEQHWIDAVDAYSDGYNTSPRLGSYVSIDNRGYQPLIEEREDDVLEMLVQIHQRRPYRQIAADFGVSLGYLGKLKIRYADLIADLIEKQQGNRERIKREEAERALRRVGKVGRNEEIVALSAQGYTYRAIAKVVGCSLGTVCAVLKKSAESK